MAIAPIEISYSPREPLSDIPREDWVKEIPKRAQLIREAIDVDLSMALRVWKDLKTHEAWQIIGLNRDQFVSTHCQLESAELDEIESIFHRYNGRIKNRDHAREIQAREARTAKLQADANKGGRGNKLGYVVTQFRNIKGNSASYLLRRLARRAPEILTRYECGEFKSVRAAALAAGIIKVKSPLDQLRSWWKKATADEREIFKKEIQ